MRETRLSVEQERRTSGSVPEDLDGPTAASLAAAADSEFCVADEDVVAFVDGLGVLPGPAEEDGSCWWDDEESWSWASKMPE